MAATIESTDLLTDLGADECVRAFCGLHGLVAATANAVRLARDCFSPEPSV